MSSAKPPDGQQLTTILEEMRGRTLVAVDAASRKRHRSHVVAGVAVATAMIVGTAASTIVIASHPWTVTPSTKTLYQLYCVEGNDVSGGADVDPYTGPFFSTSFYFTGTKGQKVEIDAVGACKTAWKRFLNTANTKLFPPYLSPSHLFHSHQFTDGGVEMSYGGLGMMDKYGGLVPPMAECIRPDEKGAAIYVISANPGETRVSKRQWEVRCEINEGFVLRK